MLSPLDKVKFQIIGDRAYTADNSLITNIAFFGYNETPTSFDYKKVIEYFQNFGSIMKIECFEVGGLFLEGTVRFDDFKSAARVLQHESHIVEQLEHLFVEASCSREPESKNMCAFLEQMVINDHQLLNTSRHETSILDLNEDCLRYIFSYLNLWEQINFALTCRYFFNIFNDISIRQFKNLKTSCLCCIEFWQSLVFIKIVGPFVQTITIDFTLDDKTFKVLGSYCANVKTLNVQEECLHLDYLIKEKDCLTTLTIETISMISDGLLLFIAENTPNLKCLTLIEIWNLTGEHIIKFSNLEELRIHSCDNMTEKNYINIFKELINLRHLDLIVVGPFKDIYSETISKNLFKLESLTLKAGSGNFNSLGKLPNLRKLEMTNNFSNIDLQFFKNVCEYQRQTIKELKLYGQNLIDFKKISLLSELKELKVLVCPYNKGLCDSSLMKISELPQLEELNVRGCNITNDGVIYLIENCQKLKRLDICMIPSLTNILLPNLMRILKNQHASLKRSDSLIIKVDEDIRQYFLINNPNLVESLNVLKIQPDDVQLTIFCSPEDDEYEDLTNFEHENLFYF